jgi:hypothetical protein
MHTALNLIWGLLIILRPAVALDMAWILLVWKILAMMDRRWPPAPKPPPPPDRPYIPPRLPP